MSYLCFCCCIVRILIPYKIHDCKFSHSIGIATLDSQNRGLSMVINYGKVQWSHWHTQEESCPDWSHNSIFQAGKTLSVFLFTSSRAHPRPALASKAFFKEAYKYVGNVSGNMSHFFWGKYVYRVCDCVSVSACVCLCVFMSVCIHLCAFHFL